jgi:hypothetical protein
MTVMYYPSSESAILADSDLLTPNLLKRDGQFEHQRIGIHPFGDNRIHIFHLGRSINGVRPIQGSSLT